MKRYYRNVRNSFTLKKKTDNEYMKGFFFSYFYCLPLFFSSIVLTLDSYLTSFVVVETKFAQRRFLFLSRSPSFREPLALQAFARPSRSKYKLLCAPRTSNFRAPLALQTFARPIARSRAQAKRIENWLSDLFCGLKLHVSFVEPYTFCDGRLEEAF